MRGELYENNDIKPTFSGHETFPLRYGWLKKVYDELDKAEKDNIDINFSANHETISTFGVGKNMVSSMQYWASYSGIFKDGKISVEARKILADDGFDPWMENPLTLWMLHFMFAKNVELTTYHWFFNYYNGHAFNRGELYDEIINLCEFRSWKVPSPITLKRDIECFIRTYVSKKGKDSNYNDDSIESPLSELSLIKPLSRYGFFVPNRGAKSTLSASIFLLCLSQFWAHNYADNASISLEAMLHDAGSPGRIFLLDESSLLELIYETEQKADMFLTWSETAGMRQFNLKARATLKQLEDHANILIEKDYTES